MVLDQNIYKNNINNLLYISLLLFSILIYKNRKCNVLYLIPFLGFLIFLYLPIVIILFTTRLTDFKLTYSEPSEGAILYLTTSLIISLFFLIFIKTNRIKLDFINTEKSSFVFNFIAIFSLLIILFKVLRQFLFILDNGFLSIYTDYHENSVLVLLYYFSKYYLLYFLIVFDFTKKFILSSMIFRSLYLIILLMFYFGLRYDALLWMTIVILIKTKNRQFNILNFRYAVILFLFGTLMQIIAILRSVNYEFKNLIQFDFSDNLFALIYFANSQASTATFIANAYDNFDYLNKSNASILYPISDPVIRLINNCNASHNSKYLSITTNVDHILTSKLNYEYWLSGGGMGSSVIIDGLMINKNFGLVMILIFLFIVLRYFNSYSKWFKYFILINYFNLFWMWRGSFVPALESILGFLFFFIIYKLSKLSN